MKKDIFIASVVYQGTLERELEWRKENQNHQDVLLLDRMISDINTLGYDFNYKTDLLYKEIDDSRIVPIIKNYLGNFLDEGITAVLIGVISKYKTEDITDTVIIHYNKTKQKNRSRLGVFYDNALKDLKDKRYIRSYVDFLNNENDALNLPFTMLMLAKWKVPEAKHIFVDYLKKIDSQLIFLSLQALGYYKDPSILPAIYPLVSSTNKDISSCAKKAISKITS